MYDVTIVGAGLAGLQLARLLAARGLSILLVDSKRRAGDHIRTTGIFVRRTFEDFPSLGPFLGPPIRTIGLHSPGGRGLEFESAHDEFRVGRMRELHIHLLRQAEDGGADWRPATTYAALELDSRGVVVHFRDGSRARSRFLVGADGACSRVAIDLGLDCNSAWIAGIETVYSSATTSQPRFDCWIDSTIAPGYLAWSLDDGAEIHVGVAGNPRRFQPANALRSFEQRLKREGRLYDAMPLERRGGLIPVNGVLRRIACDRGLLIGDAAGAVSPLTAGGLDACMRLSAHAADVLVEALQDPSAMSAYSGAAYRSRFASRLLMRRAYDIFTRWPPIVELGFIAAGTSVASALARHVFFGRGSFPDTPPKPTNDRLVQITASGRDG